MISPWQLLLIVLATGLAFGASVTYALVLDADNSTAAARRAATSQPPAEDRSNCDEILGTAFRSDDERRWYSENCSSWSAAVGYVPEPSTRAPSGPTPAEREQVDPGPEGRTCNQIRGTLYRSSAERDWYLRSCRANATPQPSATAGPDRTNCDEIRGTPYRSANEQRWYQQNCPAAPQQIATPGPDRNNCDQIRGTPYRSANEQRWYQQNCGGR
jgi:hypothetical protein